MASKNKLKFYTIRLFLMVFSPIIFLCILELLARLKYTPVSVTNDGVYEYHPNKVYTLKKNIEGNSTGVQVKTNDFGYRDDPFNKTKAKNEIRVLALGDSVTFGHGVAANQTYPEILENMLKENYKGKSFQVINAGVPGNGPMQEYYDLEEGLKFDPNAVLVQFTLNDVTEPFIVLKRLGGSGWSYHGVHDIHAIDFYLMQNSSLYCLSKNLYAELTYDGKSNATIEDKAKNREMYQKEKLITEHEHPDIQIAWDEYFSWLTKIYETCRENDIPIILLISPFEFQLTLSSEKDYPQNRIIGFCKKRNINYVNYITVIRNLFEVHNSSLGPSSDPAEFWNKYFLDHDHYTPYGHSEVAKQLKPLIIRELNLK